ncbi:MAG: PH domain-containing protein [Bacteroidetes bacterium]|nr:PH domain-containing protein [Bacteroidota bacterium]
MRFETKRDKTFPIIFLFVFILYSGIASYSIIAENDSSVIWPFSGVLLFLALLFYLIFKNTYFVFEENQLVCRSLFFKRIIPYSTIRKIEKQKGLYAGLKMSTAWKGLVIHYNKYDELLISPEREEEFILELESRVR